MVCFLSPLSLPYLIYFSLFLLLIILIFSSHGFQGAVQLLFEPGAFLCKQQPGWGKTVTFMWFIWPDQFLTSVFLLSNMIKMVSCSFLSFWLTQYIAIHYIHSVLWHRQNDLQNSLFSQRVMKPFGHATLLSSTAAIYSLYLT